MNINSVSGGADYYGPQSLQSKPESAEPKTAGPDRDGDSDDKAVAASSGSSAPTTNASGQTIGQILNVTA
ncbi:hypothetical protein QCD60_21095 [Pokkaliibacter sp. MBI-7]|uniref:hypothetical protein n=1 Tax=Pokkaliibacter sp. MBI-7 TaxID=3040600 RepID=UPI00244A035B|nr:hypothetical protein [Pokkaliibacter sp. MBI-7]MDH2435034.1 hypothetical protein [Pokkaliibacter sp. MBI-7]